MTVRRRLIVYVQGYDPRGLPEYYRMFRQEFRKMLALYGLGGEVGKAVNDPNRFIASWTIATHGPGWDVDTRYMFLRWEDIIRRDFARPTWWKTPSRTTRMPSARRAAVTDASVSSLPRRRSTW